MLQEKASWFGAGLGTRQHNVIDVVERVCGLLPTRVSPFRATKEFCAVVAMGKESHQVSDCSCGEYRGGAVGCRREAPTERLEEARIGYRLLTSPCSTFL